MITALLQASSPAAGKSPDYVWTPLLISAVIVAMGALAAFDIGGYASRSARNNTEFTPWGAKLRPPASWPHPYKIVGWAFLVVGTPIFLLQSHRSDQDRLDLRAHSLENKREKACPETGKATPMLGVRQIEFPSRSGGDG